MRIFNTKRFIIALSLTGLMGLSNAALATTATGTLTVSATVQASCTVGNATLNFGTLNPNVNNDRIANISVNCTNGAAYTLDLDQGSNYSSTRRLKDSGSNYIAYELYTDSARTQVWYNGASGTANISDTGTGNAQNKAVYGRITAAAAASATVGTYTDQVQITVNF